MKSNLNIELRKFEVWFKPKMLVHDMEKMFSVFITPQTSVNRSLNCFSFMTAVTNLFIAREHFLAFTPASFYFNRTRFILATCKLQVFLAVSFFDTYLGQILRGVPFAQLFQRLYWMKRSTTVQVCSMTLSVPKWHCNYVILASKGRPCLGQYLNMTLVNSTKQAPATVERLKCVK